MDSRIIDEYEQNILFAKVRPSRPTVIPREFLLPQSLANYEFCNDQLTIHPTPSYEEILTPVGLDLLARARAAIPQRIIYAYRRISQQSGEWYPDPTSPHYKPSAVMFPETWENMIIEGWTDTGSIATNTIILYDDSFCITRSGTIYGLRNRLK